MSDIGLTDKLYWRLSKTGFSYHCFAPANNRRWGKRVYESLCGRFQIVRTGGQAIRRPFPYQRCAECDGREMTRRGWTESGPETFDPNEDP